MPEHAVEITISSVLAIMAGGKKNYRCSGSTVRSVFENLFEQAPELRIHVLDESGGVRQHVLVYVGDENLKWIGGLDATLNGPTEMTVLQAVSGG